MEVLHLEWTEGVGTMKNWILGGAFGLFIMATMVLVAQTPPARFYRVTADDGELAIDQMTPQGVMSWTAVGSSGLTRVEYTDDLTQPDAWRVYTHVQAEDDRALVHLFDPFASVDFAYVPAGTYPERGDPIPIAHGE